MRLFINTLLLSCVTLTTYAADTSNCVSGLDSTGNTLTGNYVYHQCMKCDTCKTINNCENVSGEITDQDGNTRRYKGHWSGYGHIVGMSDDGDRIELNRVN